METIHVTSRRTYFFVYLALMVLLALTIGAAFLELGTLNPVISMLIAAVKAGLVMYFFMHVRGSSRLTRLFVILGFVWLLILITLTLGDYLTRANLPMIR